MKYCRHCGTQLDDEAKFCETCGAQQPTSSPPIQPSTTPAISVHAASTKRRTIIVGAIVAVVLAASIGMGAALVVNYAEQSVHTTTSVNSNANKDAAKDAAKSGDNADDTQNAEKLGNDTDGTASPKTTLPPTPTPKSYTAAEARNMAKHGDFTAVEGTYCTKAGDRCLSIDAKGKVTQIVGDGVNGMHIGPGGANWTQLHAENSWEPESGAAVELRGRDTDWHCVQGLSGLNACSDANASEADFDLRPIDLFWVPADTPYESLNGIAGASVEQQLYGTPVDTSKTFLYWAGYHMNDMPTDEGALYKTEK